MNLEPHDTFLQLINEICIQFLTFKLYHNFLLFYLKNFGGIYPNILPWVRPCLLNTSEGGVSLMSIMNLADESSKMRAYVRSNYDKIYRENNFLKKSKRNI
jgi:hypothetical protein